MHSNFTRKQSLILAFWLMVTSVGASIDVHFCNGEIYSIGINAQADKCAGFENEHSPYDHSSLERSPCCDQFSAYFQSDIDCGNDDVAIQFPFDSCIIPFQCEVNISENVEPIQLCHFYDPPEYEEDLLTLFSVFRI